MMVATDHSVHQRQVDWPGDADRVLATAKTRWFCGENTGQGVCLWHHRSIRRPWTAGEPNSHAARQAQQHDLSVSGMAQPVGPGSARRTPHPFRPIRVTIA